jgi:hypothetical protein
MPGISTGIFLLQAHKHSAAHRAALIFHSITQLLKRTRLVQNQAAAGIIRRYDDFIFLLMGRAVDFALAEAHSS